MNKLEQLQMLHKKILEDTMNDAQRLGELYLTLQGVSAELFEIMERHPDVKHIKDNLGKAMGGLSSIAHEIYSEAHALKKEEENENTK